MPPGRIRRVAGLEHGDPDNLPGGEEDQDGESDRADQPGRHGKVSQRGMDLADCHLRSRMYDGGARRSWSGDRYLVADDEGQPCGIRPPRGPASSGDEVPGDLARAGSLGRRTADTVIWCHRAMICEPLEAWPASWRGRRRRSDALAVAASRVNLRISVRASRPIWLSPVRDLLTGVDARQRMVRCVPQVRIEKPCSRLELKRCRTSAARREKLLRAPVSRVPAMKFAASDAATACVAVDTGPAPTAKPALTAPRNARAHDLMSSA